MEAPPPEDRETPSSSHSKPRSKREVSPAAVDEVLRPRRSSLDAKKKMNAQNSSAKARTRTKTIGGKSSIAAAQQSSNETPSSSRSNKSRISPGDEKAPPYFRTVSSRAIEPLHFVMTAPPYFRPVSSRAIEPLQRVKDFTAPFAWEKPQQLRRSRSPQAATKEVQRRVKRKQSPSNEPMRRSMRGKKEEEKEGGKEEEKKEEKKKGGKKAENKAKKAKKANEEAIEALLAVLPKAATKPMDESKPADKKRSRPSQSNEGDAKRKRNNSVDSFRGPRTRSRVRGNEGDAGEENEAVKERKKVEEKEVSPVVATEADEHSDAKMAEEAEKPTYEEMLKNEEAVKEELKVEERELRQAPYLLTPAGELPEVQMADDAERPMELITKEGEEVEEKAPRLLTQTGEIRDEPMEEGEEKPADESESKEQEEKMEVEEKVDEKAVETTPVLPAEAAANAPVALEEIKKEVEDADEKTETPLVFPAGNEDVVVPERQLPQLEQQVPPALLINAPSDETMKEEAKNSADEQSKEVKPKMEVKEEEEEEDEDEEEEEFARPIGDLAGEASAAYRSALRARNEQALLAAPPADDALVGPALQPQLEQQAPFAAPAVDAGYVYVFPGQYEEVEVPLVDFPTHANPLLHLFECRLESHEMIEVHGDGYAQAIAEIGRLWREFPRKMSVRKRWRNVRLSCGPCSCSGFIVDEAIAHLKSADHLTMLRDSAEHVAVCWKALFEWNRALLNHSVTGLDAFAVDE